ncbi:MAG: MoaD/ThiS family protein [Candidatus Thalassarchaeaceae archaeon]|jgi:molybdopterin converting factor small subunit|nr:MoaD/ThiS family protein [Candidatus Thalassarchaeaceae archaeon]MDP7043086.1 MoaD/ThiS family protein [Candidatus Thalassarchaeaceae archaeon]
MSEDGMEKVVKITVLFFGQLSEQFGTRTLELPLFEGATISDLANRLQISEMLEKGTKVALNGDFCMPDVEIPDAAEVAFLPPVSGG